MFDWRCFSLGCPCCTLYFSGECAGGIGAGSCIRASDAAARGASSLRSASDLNLLSGFAAAGSAAPATRVDTGGCVCGGHCCSRDFSQLLQKGFEGSSLCRSLNACIRLFAFAFPAQNVDTKMKLLQPIIAVVAVCFLLTCITCCSFFCPLFPFDRVAV